jgi:hypothetical protein
MNSFKSNLVFYTAVLFATWFMLTSWFWTYGVNVLFSFPFGLISYFLWRNGKKQGDRAKAYKIVSIMLSIGVIASIGTLVVLMIFN